jgi:predicted nucleic acid-binding protein
VAPKAPYVCKDADDQKFVDLAVTQQALLISKDAEVLALKNRLARLGVKVFSAYPARKDEVQALSSVSKV